MPAPLDVSACGGWPAVQTLAVAIGVRPAARRLGLPVAAVMQRSKREGWLSHLSAPAPTLPVSMRPTIPRIRTTSPDGTVSDVSMPPVTAAQAMADENADLSRRGRTATLRAGVRVVEHLADPALQVEDVLASGADAGSWVRSMAQAGSWEAKAPQTNVMVSVQMLGMRPEVLEVEGRVRTVQDSTD